MGDLPSSDVAEPDLQPRSSPSMSPLPDSELEAYIARYPFAAEPTYFTRPNRYYGPASTWRSWTAREREVAGEVLHHSRATDLSVHLYNAFALKQKASSASTGRVRVRSRSRSRARSADDQDPQDSFAPPDVWTAWPLRARDVPREPSGNGTGPSTLLGRSKSRPSAALEEALIASSLRHAKERWNERGWEPAKPQFDHSKRDCKAELAQTKKQLGESGLHEDEDVKPKGRSFDDQDMQVADDVTDSEIVSSTEFDQPVGVPTFSSQAFAPADSSSSEDELKALESEDDKPVFSADDDQAIRVLAPSARHILSKLDDLLAGLHEARLRYAVRDPNSRTHSNSRAESTDDEHFIRSGSRAASKQRGRKRKRSVSAQEDHSSGENTRSKSRSRPVTRQFGTKGRGFGLRDWSDVLGMAALTGWKTETIARARERCANLFSQNMMFRIFHEGDEEAPSQKYKEPYFEAELAYVPTAANKPSQLVPDEITSLGSHRLDSDDNIQYGRTSSSCDRCRRQGLRCVPPDSLRDVVDEAAVACAACTSVRDLKSPCSGIFVKLKTRHDQPSPYSSRTCPYPDCPRYISGKPFAKRYGLERHLKTVHGHQYSPPPGSPSKAATTIILPVRQKVDHERVISCPIPSCPQRRHAYARSTRLYSHIRHAHPDFDLEEYKKVASKGTRGKYDRSRSRGGVRKNVQELEDEETSSDDENGDIAHQRTRLQQGPDSSDNE